MSTNKSFSTETSERYSRALFEVANEAKELDTIEVNLQNFQSLLKTSSEIKNFTEDPTQSVNNQKKSCRTHSRKIFFYKKFKKFLFAIDW